MTEYEIDPASLLSSLRLSLEIKGKRVLDEDM